MTRRAHRPPNRNRLATFACSPEASPRAKSSQNGRSQRVPLIPIDRAATYLAICCASELTAGALAEPISLRR